MDQVHEGRMKRIRYWDVNTDGDQDHNNPLDGQQEQEDPHVQEGGQAQWANFRGQVEIIIGLVSDNHIFISME